MMKKTITPVIAVILLIMLTIAVSATAWYWVNNLQGSLESGAGQGLDTITGMGQMQYNIVGAVCNKTSRIIITLRNNGALDIATTEAFLVKLVSLAGEELNSTVASVGTTLETTGTSSIGYLNISGAFGGAMTAGQTYQIKTDFKGILDSENCIAIE